MTHERSQPPEPESFVLEYADALGKSPRRDRILALCEALRGSESAEFVLLLRANEPAQERTALPGDDLPADAATSPAASPAVGLPRDFTVLAVAEKLQDQGAEPRPLDPGAYRPPVDSLLPVTPFLVSVLGSNGPIRREWTSKLSEGLDPAQGLGLGGTDITFGWGLAGPDGWRRGVLLMGASREAAGEGSSPALPWTPCSVRARIVLDRLAFELGRAPEVAEPPPAQAEDGGHRQDMELARLTERLRASEARYRRFIGSTTESIWCLEPAEPIPSDTAPGEIARLLGKSARLTEGNLTFARRFGLMSTIDLPPTDLKGFWLLADPERLAELARNSFFAQDLIVAEDDDSGRPRYLACGLYGVADAGGLRQIWAIERDVTGQIEEAQLLRKSNEFYKTISETALDGICVLDGDLSLVDCNDAFAALAHESRADLRERGRITLTPVTGLRDDPVPFRTIAEQGRWRGEAILHRPGLEGDEHSIRVELACRFKGHGTPRYYCFVRDLSERHSAERRDNDHQQALAHVARLSTLGEMTSGIAHELNQPLAAILNYANGCTRILETQGLDDPLVFRGLKAITVQGERAANIIRRMRSFAVREGDIREPFAVEDILAEAIEMSLPDLNRAGVSVDTDFAPNGHVVNVDGIQIEQVAIHLIRNAIEAFTAETAAGGAALQRRIWVRSWTDEAQVGLKEPVVRVSVADNGPGIPESIGARLFDPFVSRHRKGIGLGLTISRSIIESHGGRLWYVPIDEAVGDAVNDDWDIPRGSFDQEGNVGAAFHFTLPLRMTPIAE